MSIDLSKMPKIGFGLMRLPENDGVIDIDKVSKMADSYLEAGFTYFDTAYVYHGGNSEKIVKEAIVKRYPRDSSLTDSRIRLTRTKSPSLPLNPCLLLNRSASGLFVLYYF